MLEAIVANLSCFSIPYLSIEIVDGDIAAQATDAVVNAANNAFWMGAGVAGAIKARGGQAIEDEAVAQGPVEPGECVMTSGGRLPARHVIHAAVMGQNLRTSATLITRATTNALAMGEAYGLGSMSLPAFGTGVGGFPIHECARLMLEVVKAHASSARSLRLVRFVLFGHTAYGAFEHVAQDIFSGQA
jgi:O-acetyl-ADP-ribose deacetylase (regulator of RNase III)